MALTSALLCTALLNGAQHTGSLVRTLLLLFILLLGVEWINAYGTTSLSQAWCGWFAVLSVHGFHVLIGVYLCALLA